MAYKALYRTYRPQSFKDVIGQEVIVKTLQNALNNGRVSHAYLFCGPRGTGKTTIARLFAKALNCTDFNGEPCNACQNCRDITEGINPDVIEIDAASNNSVDEIRDLKDKIKYLPAGSKFKIYIIDEVHMLTTSAFNALLKTLEEPPKHAIFILATTEPQKVLPTIISRCQRFDFSSLTLNELLEALENICINENVDYDKEALMAICKASDGGLRDAISFLDQAISLSDNKITEEIASSVTGLLSKSKLFDLTKYIESKNVSDAILTVKELQNEGKEIGKIINSLLGFYRDILLCKTVPDKFDNEFIDFSNTIELNKVYFNIDVLSDVQSKIKYGSTPDIYLEVAIIKMINTTKDELDYNNRISLLEEKLANGNFESTSSGESMDVEDLKRIKILEVKLNNLLTELSKMNLQSVIDTVKKLCENNNTSNLEPQIDNTKIKDLQSQVDKFNEELSLLKSVQTGFRTELDNTRSGDVNEQMLIEKIEIALRNTNKVSVTMDEVKAYVNNELSNVKFDINNLPKGSFTNNTNNTDLSNIEERLSKAESNIYKILAGMLSPKSNILKKREKVNEKQISLWKDEIVDVEKVANPDINERVDFKDLAKDEELLPLDKALIQANVELGEENSNTVTQEKEDDLPKEKSIQNEEELDNESNYSEEELKELGYDEEESNEDEELEDEESEESDEVIEDEEENGNLFGETEFEAPEQIEPKSNNYEESSWYKDDNQDKEQTISLSESNENLFSDTKEETVTDTIIDENPIEESIRIENEQVENEPVLETKEEETVEEAKEVVEENVLEKVEEKVEEPIVELDEYERFDCNTLLRIFNNAKYYNAVFKKFKELWPKLTSITPIEQINVASILQEGEVKAVNDHEFLLVYDDYLIVNQVVSRKFRKSAKKLIFDLLGEEYNYFVIPRDIYLKETNIWGRDYYLGTICKQLEPINDSRLHCDTKDEEENPMIKKAKELFGDELTIKKKEEN